MPVNFNPDMIEDAVGRAKPKEDKPPKTDPDFVPRPDGLTAKRKPGRRSADIATIEDGLTQAFGMLGMGLSMVNMYDAMVIHENAELLARHWTKVAEQNPKVKKYLLTALSGGSWLGAISVTAAVLIPIAANHDAVSDELAKMSMTLGVKIPERQEVPELSGSSNGNGTA